MSRNGLLFYVLGFLNESSKDSYSLRNAQIKQLGRIEGSVIVFWECGPHLMVLPRLLWQLGEPPA